MSFQIGDMVIKPALGLCKITGVRKMQVDGRDEEFFIVYCGDVKVMIPRGRAEKGELRRPITEDEIGSLYSMFEEPVFFDDDDPDNPYHLDRVKMNEAMSTWNPIELATWIRALFNHEKDMPMTKQEADYWTKMMRMMTEELSHIEHTTRGKITVKIKGLLQAARKRRKEKVAH